MSKHNYSQYSNKKQKNSEMNADVETVDVMQSSTIDTIETDTTAVETNIPEIKPVIETVDTVALPESVDGVVVNCVKLNVRVAPNATADVVCALDAKSEIEINIAKSTDDWFHVCTAAGIEGYCMRRFVEAHL